LQHPRIFHRTLTTLEKNTRFYDYASSPLACFTWDRAVFVRKVRGVRKTIVTWLTHGPISINGHAGGTLNPQTLQTVSTCSVISTIMLSVCVIYTDSDHAVRNLEIIQEGNWPRDVLLQNCHYCS